MHNYNIGIINKKISVKQGGSVCESTLMADFASSSNFNHLIYHLLSHLKTPTSFV